MVKYPDLESEMQVNALSWYVNKMFIAIYFFSQDTIDTFTL